jgi:hypothetical protein
MIDRIVYSAEFVDMQDVIDKVNECVCALNALGSETTANNSASTSLCECEHLFIGCSITGASCSARGKKVCK